MATEQISFTRRVHILPDELVNQIAAGEVVERPASVIKELLENALDAGAREIGIVLEQGGRRLIEVSDDGCGMSEADALLALERHATSKIAAFEDLLSVSTLGFRGEALPSIASVSRFSLLTWDGTSPHPIEVECLPGSPPTARPAARGRGTTVRVEDLFENVPARRKFLRSSDAEFRAIIGVVSSYALSRPDRAFRVMHNGRLSLDLPAAADTRERVIQVLGDEVSANLSEVELTLESCRASGFVTRGIRYGSRRNQFFFVNGRLVRDRVLTHAATRACAAFDANGHPGVVLFLSIDPHLVDVNVHPAKTEVRFRDSGQVHVAVEIGVRNALGGPEQGEGLLRAAEGPDSMPEMFSRPRPQQQELTPPVFIAGSAPQPQFEAAPLFRQKPLVQPPDARPVDLGDLQGKIIGQYRDSYILLDSPEGLRLIDQHVAHERVLYDRLASGSAQEVSSQKLLHPYMYETGAAEAGLLGSHLEELREVGFEIEPFSGRSFAVSAIPSLLRRDSLERFFGKVLDRSEGQSHVEKLKDKILATIACHAAIKVHRPLSGPEMSQVVTDLLASSNPFACPHGRPIIVDIRHLDIEKHFHRK